MMSIPLHQDYWHQDGEPIKREIDVTKLTVPGLDPRLWIEASHTESGQFIGFAVQFCDETIPTRDFRDAALVTSRLAKVLARLSGAPDSEFDRWRRSKQWRYLVDIFPHGCHSKEAVGWVYPGDLYIQINPCRTPPTDWQYRLIIAQAEWRGNDLLDLEHKLYDYAKAEGLF